MYVNDFKASVCLVANNKNRKWEIELTIWIQMKCGLIDNETGTQQRPKRWCTQLCVTVVLSLMNCWCINLYNSKINFSPQGFWILHLK